MGWAPPAVLAWLPGVLPRKRKRLPASQRNAVLGLCKAIQDSWNPAGMHPSHGLVGVQATQASQKGKTISISHLRHQGNPSLPSIPPLAWTKEEKEKKEAEEEGRENAIAHIPACTAPWRVARCMATFSTIVPSRKCPAQTQTPTPRAAQPQSQTRSCQHGPSFIHRQSARFFSSHHPSPTNSGSKPSPTQTSSQTCIQKTRQHKRSKSVPPPTPTFLHSTATSNDPPPGPGSTVEFPPFPTSNSCWGTPPLCSASNKRKEQSNTISSAGISSWHTRNTSNGPANTQS